jgi:hypothetical protein
MTVSPELLLSLSPAVLRDVLAVFGGDKTTGTTHAAVRELFTKGASKKKLAEALATVRRFSTRAGRAALVEAAVASSDEESAAEFAQMPEADAAPWTLLAIERETKASRRRALRRLFALAGHRVSRDLPARATYELGVEGEGVAGERPSVVARRLESAFGDRRVDTWIAKEEDGSSTLALFLKQPIENSLVYDDASRTKIAARHSVPIAVDLVRVLPGRSRVSITTALPELLGTYARALSLSLRPSFTLRPLQTLSPNDLARLSREARGVTAMDVVGVRHRRPDGTRIEVRGPNALDPRELGARTGYIDRVTIRLTMDAGATVDAFLQLPHRVEISDPAFEEPVRAALTALGLFNPGALPDDARSLAPYLHGDWRWRAVLGDSGFDALVKRGLLVRAEASHVSSHEHRMHGAGYIVRDVPGEPSLKYALAEDRSLGARLVGAKDRAALRLDARALAASMAHDLGAQPAPLRLEVAGVLDLGIVSLASGKLRVVYAMSEPTAGWVESVRRAVGLGTTPVVLVPRGHAGDARGMLEVELDVAEQLGARPLGKVLGRIAEGAGVPHEVEGWRLCDEEIVIDPKGQRLWVTGVAVALSEAPWRFIEYLARHGVGRAALSKDIGAYLSKSDYPDVVARKTRATFERQVRQAFEKAGADDGVVGRILVSEGRLGVRLGVSVRVLGDE